MWISFRYIIAAKSERRMVLYFCISIKYYILILLDMIRIETHFPLVRPSINFTKSVFDYFAVVFAFVVFSFWKYYHRVIHCVKSVRIRSHSGLHFPTFGLNKERYSVSIRIQSECRKIQTKITPNTDTFYAVILLSKTLDMSRNTLRTSKPWSSDWYVSWVIDKSWLMQESPGLKLDWC